MHASKSSLFLVISLLFNVTTSFAAEPRGVPASMNMRTVVAALDTGQSPPTQTKATWDGVQFASADCTSKDETQTCSCDTKCVSSAKECHCDDPPDTDNTKQ
jgi:hypothetical protein